MFSISLDPFFRFWGYTPSQEYIATKDEQIHTAMERDEARRKGEELRAAVKHANTRIEDLQNELESERSINADLSQSVDALTEELESARQLGSSLRGERDAAQISLQAAERQLEHLREEAKTSVWAKRVTDLEAKVRELTQAVRTKQDEVYAAQSSFRTLKSIHKVVEQNIALAADAITKYMSAVEQEADLRKNRKGGKALADARYYLAAYAIQTKNALVAVMHRVDLTDTLPASVANEFARQTEVLMRNGKVGESGDAQG